MSDNHRVIEEPCDGKLSSTVLESGGSREGVADFNALDLETPTKQNTYLGKRVKRGLFQSHSGVKVNADVNGSLQITRKVFPNAYTVEGIASAAVAPLKVTPLLSVKSEQMKICSLLTRTVILSSQASFRQV